MDIRLRFENDKGNPVMEDQSLKLAESGLIPLKGDFYTDGKVELLIDSRIFEIKNGEMIVHLSGRLV